ncbi:MAG TPA: hypothetical protein VGJ72_12560 [Polaromonas sp.]|jgi:predicted P-loop ATPase
MKRVLAALLLAVAPLAQAERGFSHPLVDYLDYLESQRDTVPVVQTEDWVMIISGGGGSKDVTNITLHPETLRVYRHKGVEQADMLVTRQVFPRRDYRRDREAVTGCEQGHGEIVDVDIKGVPVDKSQSWMTNGERTQDWVARRICAARGSKARWWPWGRP